MSDAGEHDDQDDGYRVEYLPARDDDCSGEPVTASVSSLAEIATESRQCNGARGDREYVREAQRLRAT